MDSFPADLDPTAFWLRGCGGPEIESDPMISHCRNGGITALREIAGIAVARGISQAAFAKSYKKLSGRQGIADGNISARFTDDRPIRPKTLRLYADVVGMSDLHLQIVSEKWPVLRPTDGSFGELVWQDVLDFDSMQLLYASSRDTGPLYEVRRLYEQDRDFFIELVNRVHLRCERRFAGPLYRMDRNKRSDRRGVTRETWEQFDALRYELNGRFDLSVGLSHRNAYEERIERTLVDLWASLVMLTSDRQDWNTEDYLGIPHSPKLEVGDLVAIMDLARRLMSARGIDVSKMNDRLDRESSFEYWLSDLNEDPETVSQMRAFLATA